MEFVELGFNKTRMKNSIIKTKWRDFKSVLGWYIYSLSISGKQEEIIEINNKPKKNVLESVQYSINSVKEVISFLPNQSIKYLKNKNILEIGPGQDIGVVLVLMGLGAKKSYLVDPFFYNWNDELHCDYYMELLKKVTVEFPNYQFDALKQVCKIKSYNLPNLFILKSGLEQVENIPNKEIDISFSNACFEHFNNSKKAIQELARITKPGGIGFHQIDLRDHRDYTLPLEFLTMSDFMFSKFSKYSNCCSGNRIRHYEFIAYFNENDFKCNFTPNMFADTQYLNKIKHKMNGKYKKINIEILKPLSGRFFIKKL